MTESARPPLTDQAILVGAWTLVSATYLQNGQLAYPYGEHPLGQLILTAGGVISCQAMRGDHQAHRTTRQYVQDQFHALQDAPAGLLPLSYTGFWGRYVINLPEAQLTIHCDGSLAPELVGSYQVRSFQITNELLTLSNSSLNVEGQPVSYEVIWKPAGDS